jgi:magnesium chelatase subunit I
MPAPIQNEPISVLPYSYVVGQDRLKLALEIAYISPAIGGVLVRGERGTGKSTAVRAFAIMMSDEGKPPVTLPISATEDRVLGGWMLEKLLLGRHRWRDGLLEQARGGLLYIDEVNLLDDHLVNMLLDAASTGFVVVQRDGRDYQRKVRFTLVGTMNPEEGDLRPQLLDRFGLEVEVGRADAEAASPEVGRAIRRQILEKVLRYEAAPDQVLAAEQETLAAEKRRILAAKDLLAAVTLPEEMCDLCLRLAQRYDTQGHRGELVLVLAARAAAALRAARIPPAGEHPPTAVTAEDVRAVAAMALQHRLPLDTELRTRRAWDARTLDSELAGYAGG